MSTATKELYVHYSHRNFAGKTWREAADRYQELLTEIAHMHSIDAGIDHDKLTDNFESCETCGQLYELEQFKTEFARAFAHIWAAKALRGAQ